MGMREDIAVLSGRVGVLERANKNLVDRIKQLECPHEDHRFDIYSGYENCIACGKEIGRYDSIGELQKAEVKYHIQKAVKIESEMEDK